MNDSPGTPEQTGPDPSTPPPYGHGSPSPPPYGVPPGGEPAYGQLPYGQTPYHDNPYGAPTWGMPGYGAPLRDPEARPGTVLAAGIITLVTSGLVLVLFVVFTLFLVVVRDDFVRGFQQGAGLGASGSPEGWFAGILVGFLVMIAWCVAAIVLAVLALRRSRAGRIGLVVSSSLCALVSLVAITGVVSVVTLAAAVAVIVCLFTGGAGAWYRREPGPTVPGMVRY